MNRCCEKSSGCPGQCGQGKSMRSSHLRWDSSVRRSHARGSQILAFQAGLSEKIWCLKVDYDSIGIPRRFSSKESAWQCRRHGLDLRVRKVPWSKKKWPPTPVLLSGEFHGERSLAGYSPWGPRVEQDWAHTLVSLCDSVEVSDAWLLAMPRVSQSSDL